MKLLGLIVAFQAAHAIYMRGGRRLADALVFVAARRALSDWYRARDTAWMPSTPGLYPAPQAEA